MSGEDTQSIARHLGRSERWVYKLAGRYEGGEERWFVSESRRPHGGPTTTSEELIALVLRARDRLEGDPRAQRMTKTLRRLAQNGAS